MNTTRALMQESELPDQYIHYGLRHAVDSHNSMVSSSLPVEDSIPYIRHFKEPVTFRHLLPFSSYVACFLPKALGEPGNHQTRAQAGVYLGRSSNQGYASGIVASFPNGKSIVTLEYQADPSLFPLRTQQAQRFRPFAHPSPVTGFGKDYEMDLQAPNKVQKGDSTWLPNQNESDSDKELPALAESEDESEEEMYISPPHLGGQSSNKTFETAPVKSQSKYNTRSKGKDLLRTNSTRKPKIEAKELPNVPQTNPGTITDACKRPDAEKWIEAADTEWENLMKHEALDWVDSPQESQVIGTTMVFKAKYNQDGSLEKYKARVCGKGDQQKEKEGESGAEVR